MYLFKILYNYCFVIWNLMKEVPWIVEIVRYYIIHIHAYDNSKRSMHDTTTWWNHLRDENDYVSNFLPFLKIHFYSLSLSHSFIHQYHSSDVHDARDLESIFSLCSKRDIHFFITKGKRQKTKEKWYQVLKKNQICIYYCV